MQQVYSDTLSAAGIGSQFLAIHNTQCIPVGSTLSSLHAQASAGTRTLQHLHMHTAANSAEASVHANALSISQHFG